MEDEWNAAMARIDEKLRRNAELQSRWKRNPATLIDAARLLCDPDAPPPTAEELQWLLNKLLEHQKSVEQLIELTQLLLKATEGNGTNI